MWVIPDVAAGEDEVEGSVIEFPLQHDNNWFAAAPESSESTDSASAVLCVYVWYCQFVLTADCHTDVY